MSRRLQLVELRFSCLNYLLYTRRLTAFLAAPFPTPILSLKFRQTSRNLAGSEEQTGQGGWPGTISTIEKIDNVSIFASCLAKINLRA